MVSVSGYLIGSQAIGRMPLPPKAELQWWYQYYFATERGRLGYQQNTRDFAKLIWQLASPKWQFDDATFDRSAAALGNPDHVSIVIHNYRWRLGLAEGEPKYDDLERRLAELPVIAVPTITLEGDANGAPHPDPSAYAKKFFGKYEHRLIKGGIGTTCRRKPRGISPKRSSTSPPKVDRHLATTPRLRGTRPDPQRETAVCRQSPHHRAAVTTAPPEAPMGTSMAGCRLLRCR